MRFKEIKPGMVIHCPKEEDAKVLLEYLGNSGYGRHVNLIDWVDKNTCYVINAENKWVTRSNTMLYGERYITEFSDLIEQEPRFKVGDKAKVRSDLIIGRGYGNNEFVEDMEKQKGKIVTIRRTDCRDYRIEEDKGAWNWTDEMLEPVDDSPINSDTNSPMTAAEDLVSKEELYRQLRLYLSKNSIGESTADTEMRVGEIASVIKGCPTANGKGKSTEMSAVEVLEWLKNADIPTIRYVSDGYSTIDGFLLHNSPQEVVDKITAYEVTKKAPKPVEVEWVDAYEIRDTQTHKVMNMAKNLTEDEFAKQFSECLAEIGTNHYAVHMRQCIVKEGAE